MAVRHLVVMKQKSVHHHVSAWNMTQGAAKLSLNRNWLRRLATGEMSRSIDRDTVMADDATGMRSSWTSARAGYHTTCSRSALSQASWTWRCSPTTAFVLFLCGLIVSCGSSDPMGVVLHDRSTQVCVDTDIGQAAHFDRPFISIQLVLPLASFAVGIAFGRSCVASPRHHESSSSGRILVDTGVQCTTYLAQAPPKSLWVTLHGACYHQTNCKTLTNTRRMLRPCLVCRPELG